VNEALVDRLRRAAHGLNLAAVEEEYRDPFWWDRYGERGLGFAQADGQHHFDYVAEAVLAGNPHVMAKYARWLRSVLVTRGMSSEHLADGFRIRARKLADTAWPDVQPCLDALATAADALLHGDPPAAGLVPHPGARPLPLWTALARDHTLDVADIHHDARHLLSYLADALAMARPDLLRDHLVWRAGFERRRGRSDAYLPALLAALTTHVAAAPPAHALLTTAAEALP